MATLTVTKELIDQLRAWDRKGYRVVLSNHCVRGDGIMADGWVCEVSNIDIRSGPNGSSDGKPRINATSGICPTPEAAIEELLVLVQP